MRATASAPNANVVNSSPCTDRHVGVRVATDVELP
jgi:hypothetical protein